MAGQWSIYLEAVEYISCNLTVTVSGESQDISSNRAYIVNITNPYELKVLPECVTECPTATECENPTKLNVTTNAAHKEQLLMAQLMIICVLIIIIDNNMWYQMLTVTGICVMLSAGQLMFHELSNVCAVIINMYSMICFLIVDW